MPEPRSDGHPSFQVPHFPTFDPKFVQQAFAPFLGAAPQPNGGAIAPLNGSAISRWWEMNQHWTMFLMRRLQTDVALVHQLADCRDLPAATEVYAAFFKTALSDYQSEVAALSSLSQEMLADVYMALPCLPIGDSRNSSFPTR
jgi:hypothetical protein